MSEARGAGAVVVQITANPSAVRLRHIYHLVWVMQSLGRAVVIVSPLRERIIRESDDYGSQMLELPGVAAVREMPRDVAGWLVTDDHRDIPDLQRWERIFRLSFDVFGLGRTAEWASQRPTIQHPFPMHPYLLTREMDASLDPQSDDRGFGLVFAGNIDPAAYHDHCIGRDFGVANRVDALEALRLRGGNVHFVASCDDMDSCRGSMAPVIVDIHKCWIPQDEWLRFLASSHYFLCLPGVAQPMCHNVVESMSVGAIPVTQTADLFHPPLEHGRNCVVVQSPEAAADVVNLPVAARRDLRSGVLEYYRTHMTPAGFFRKVDAIPVQEIHLLLNANRLSVRLMRERLGLTAE